MGNHNFKPQQAFGKNKPVGVRGCSFSKEHVPVELLRYGRLGYSQKVGKMYQSRGGHEVYVNKVKFPNGKEELFLCSDLSAPTKADLQPVKQQSSVGRSAGPRNSGSRIVNSRYKS